MLTTGKVPSARIACKETRPVRMGEVGVKTKLLLVVVSSLTSASAGLQAKAVAGEEGASPEPGLLGKQRQFHCMLHDSLVKLPTGHCLSV